MIPVSTKFTSYFPSFLPLISLLLYFLASWLLHRFNATLQVLISGFPHHLSLRLWMLKLWLSLLLLRNASSGRRTFVKTFYGESIMGAERLRPILRTQPKAEVIPARRYRSASVPCCTALIASFVWVAGYCSFEDRQLLDAYSHEQTPA